MRPKIEEAPKARTDRGLNKGDDISKPHLSNPTAPSDQDFCDDILTCWRWARALDHRLDVYQLQFEHDVAGALATDNQALANEISSFRTIVNELAR